MDITWEESGGAARTTSPTMDFDVEPAEKAQMRPTASNLSRLSGIGLLVAWPSQCLIHSMIDS